MVTFIQHKDDDSSNQKKKPAAQEEFRIRDTAEKKKRRPRRRKKSSSENASTATATQPVSTQPAVEKAAAKSGPQKKKREPETKETSRADTTVASTTAETTDAPRKKRKQRPRQRKPQTNEPTTVSAEKTPHPWDPATYQVEPMEGKTRFHDLHIADELLHAIADLGWKYCTPIQAGILPAALQGRDCTGRAQTGTGKTAAFLLAAMDRLLKAETDSEKKYYPRMLVLAPTRELVKQIEKDAQTLAKHTPLNVISIYGGASYNRQREDLTKYRPDIIIATPGRLIDLLQQKTIHLNHSEVLVIDEADRMLDMGFIPDVRNIVRRTPPRAQRHTLLFSATLTSDVIRLASQWLKDPEVVEIEPEQVVTDTVEQRVFIVENEKKFPLLLNLIFSEHLEQIIIFANRRDTVYELHRQLQRYDINCAMISGALSQSKRERTLNDFKTRKIKVLIATDVAGRGLHVEGISHVINYNLPTDPEDYVHRIGRTGRAGSTGTSISFACEDESFYLPDIEEYLGAALACVYPEDELLQPPPEPTHPEKARKPSSSNRQRRPRRRSGPPRRRS